MPGGLDPPGTLSQFVYTAGGRPALSFGESRRTPGCAFALRSSIWIEGERGEKNGDSVNALSVFVGAGKRRIRAYRTGARSA
jgi:hypothetical protein